MWSRLARKIEPEQPAPDDACVVSTKNLRPAFEEDIIIEFVDWVRTQDAQGWWLADEIDEMIEMFCDCAGYLPPPRDRARNLIVRVPGVIKERKRLTGSEFVHIARRTKLDRATLYWIPPNRPATGHGPGPGHAQKAQQSQNVCTCGARGHLGPDLARTLARQGVDTYRPPLRRRA